MQAAYGLSTAAVWGAADFTGGIAAKRAAPSFVVAVAHGFSLILLFAFAAVFRTGLSGCGLDGLLSGVFCGGGLILLYSALSRGSMGLSAAISGVLTAVVPVLYSSFREEHASPRQLIGFVVAIVAIALVAYTPQSESFAQSRGLGLAVLAGPFLWSHAGVHASGRRARRVARVDCHADQQHVGGCHRWRRCLAGATSGTVRQICLPRRKDAAAGDAGGCARYFWQLAISFGVTRWAA